MQNQISRRFVFIQNVHISNGLARIREKPGGGDFGRFLWKGGGVWVKMDPTIGKLTKFGSKRTFYFFDLGPGKAIIMDLKIFT